MPYGYNGKILHVDLMEGKTWVDDEKTLTVTTTQRLAEALPDIMSQVVSRASSPIPKGGMSVLVNGTRAQGLVQQGYLLRDGDEITLVPVVAGG